MSDNDIAPDPGADPPETDPPQGNPGNAEAARRRGVYRRLPRMSATP